MLIKCKRNKLTGKVDCIELCPQTLEEVSLMNQLVENKVNFKAGCFLLLKEDKLRERKVELQATISPDGKSYMIEEYNHG